MSLFPTARSGVAPLYAVLGLAVLVGLAIFGYQIFDRDEEAVAEPAPVVLDAAALAQVPGISIGDPNAPVVIYEFADFQCPGCGQYAAFVMPLVREKLVDPGLVRYVYYDFPLAQIHPNAFLAARSARCANEQDEFWDYHDLLYGRQASWAPVDRAEAVDLFTGYAEEVGLNGSAFEACLRSDRYQREISETMQLGESLGVNGTPTLFVNGRRLPQVPAFSDLERIVREETGTAAAPDAATAPHAEAGAGT